MVKVLIILEASTVVIEISVCQLWDGVQSIKRQSCSSNVELQVTFIAKSFAVSVINSGPFIIVGSDALPLLRIFPDFTWIQMNQNRLLVFVVMSGGQNFPCRKWLIVLEVISVKNTQRGAMQDLKLPLSALVYRKVVLWNGTARDVFGLASIVTMISEWSDVSKGGNTSEEHFSEHDGRKTPGGLCDVL